MINANSEELDEVMNELHKREEKEQNFDEKHLTLKKKMEKIEVKKQQQQQHEKKKKNERKKDKTLPSVMPMCLVKEDMRRTEGRNESCKNKL